MSLRQRGFIGISQCKLETDRSRTAGVKTAIAVMSNVLKRLGAARDSRGAKLGSRRLYRRLKFIKLKISQTCQCFFESFSPTIGDLSDIFIIAFKSFCNTLL